MHKLLSFRNLKCSKRNMSHLPMLRLEERRRISGYVVRLYMIAAQGQKSLFVIGGQR